MHVSNPSKITLLAAFSLSLMAAIQYTGGLGLLPLYLAGCGVVIWAAALLAISAPPAAKPEGHATRIVLTFMPMWLAAALPLSAMPALSLELAISLSTLSAVYFLSLRTLRNPHSWDDFLFIFQLACAATAVIGIVEFLMARTRTMSILRDFNSFAALMNMGIFSHYGSLLKIWRETRSLRQSSGFVGLLALYSMALATTQSLGGLICFSGGCLMLLVIAGWRDRKTTAFVSLSIALLIASYALVMVYRNEADGPLDKLSNLGEQLTATNRIMMWKSAWAMFLDHPWTGIGIGMYKTFYPAYRDPGDVTSSGDMAHNDYLQTLAEGGAPLMLCILALLAVVLAKLFAIWRLRSTTPVAGIQEKQDRDLRLGLLTAVLVVQMHAFINFIYYVMPLAFAMGLMLARTDLTPLQPADVVEWPQPRKRLWASLLAIAFVILTGTIGMRAIFAKLVWGHVEYPGYVRLSKDQNFLEGLANYIAATQPTWLPARYFLVDRYVAAGQVATQASERDRWRLRALLESADVIERVPRASLAHFRVAQLLEQNPGLAARLPRGISPSAETEYREALDLNPQDVRNRVALAQLLSRSGRDADAFELLFVGGLRWSGTLAATDAGNHELLAQSLPLAIKLGRCQEASQLVADLRLFDDQDPAINPSKVDVRSTSPGCGSAEPRP